MKQILSSTTLWSECREREKFLKGYQLSKERSECKDCGKRACPAVCKSVIGQIDAELTTKERESVEVVEKKMRAWCDNSKGKDKTMCYYMGVGDAEQGTSGGVKRDISSALTRGINAKRLCNRLKKKDGQMCELK